MTGAQGDARITRSSEADGDEVMRKLVVLEYVSLDGVIQAPGHAGEDGAGGFGHGGWSVPFMSDHRRYVIDSFRAADALLLGRITYEIFAAYWPTVTDAGDEIAGSLNTCAKYVASTTLRNPSWQGTTLIGSDLGGEVAKLKERPGKDIVVIGSATVAQTLARHGLVDEYRLMLHPIVLGSGKRLFEEGALATPMSLVDTRTTTTGLVILTYRPSERAGEAAEGRQAA
jgi:dihydrofolate reductase